MMLQKGRLSSFLRTFQTRWPKPNNESLTKTCFCKVCFQQIKPDSIHSIINPIPTICSKCMSNFTPVFLTISIDGVKGFAIYPYADLVQSSLYKLNLISAKTQKNVLIKQGLSLHILVDSIPMYVFLFAHTMNFLTLLLKKNSGKFCLSI